MTEADLASFVEDLLTRFGWHWVHFRPGRVMRRGKEVYETPYTGNKGFLDYICLRPPRVVVIELKSETGKMTPEQQEWFDLWEQCYKTLLTTLQEIERQVILTPFQLKPTIIVLLPEIYLFRPSDSETNGGKILEVLR